MIDFEFSKSIIKRECSMQEHKITCKCGFKVILTAPDIRNIKLYCERCNRFAYPIEELHSQSSIPSIVEVDYQTQRTTPKSKMSSSGAKKMKRSGISGPKQIGEYQIIKRIGSGGMGKLFLASYGPDKEKVVIKVLNLLAAKADEQAQLMDYFIREAQILKQLDHPYIVKFRGCGNYQGAPYIAMEYADGEDLKAVLLKHPIKLPQAISIVYHVASALEYGTRFKLIHRDIKPANIILLENNKKYSPKLIDFGLAKTLGEHYSSLTQEGTALGTPFYMPKEQILDAKNADHRSDVYALGATFYHMLAGRPPFQEYASQGGVAIMEAIVGNKVTPLEELKPGLPRKIYEIVNKSMASSPQNRYPSAIALKQDVKNFLNSVRG